MISWMPGQDIDGQSTVIAISKMNGQVDIHIRQDIPSNVEGAPPQFLYTQPPYL